MNSSSYLFKMLTVLICTNDVLKKNTVFILWLLDTTTCSLCYRREAGLKYRCSCINLNCKGSILCYVFQLNVPYSFMKTMLFSVNYSSLILCMSV